MPMTELLETLFTPRSLSIVFQRIFDITSDLPATWGIEALTRGAPGTHFERAGVLFDYVRLKHQESRVDRLCMAEALACASALDHLCVLSLNVHASTLERDDDLALFLEDAAARCGIDPVRIVVEIVEQVPYFDSKRLLRTLASLRAIGVRIAVDDLGFGNCNYRMILDARPEFLKVDRYFVDGCAKDFHRQAVLRSSRGLADDFGSVVIAEGVEQADDLSMLRTLGITVAQGFLLGRPSANPFLTPHAIPRHPEARTINA